MLYWEESHHQKVDGVIVLGEDSTFLEKSLDMHKNCGTCEILSPNLLLLNFDYIPILRREKFCSISSGSYKYVQISA